MIRTYAATTPGSDVIVHGFFVDGVLRGAADLRRCRRTTVMLSVVWIVNRTRAWYERGGRQGSQLSARYNAYRRL